MFTQYFTCKHHFIPIKKTNNCNETSHNCIEIKPWLQAFYDKKQGK
ncbi:hypothetical protein HMPREF9420_2530 [Segatella salivae DSM 15606]|uniref:Uncharacterized protein n=1 Tax=Segatella salivae DSM 15606 TaxID=888832 RepID=E6MSR2_9BACT|nr:hypothetical protein HMPREF9420_2530 [Segatella salivae DSM 15606]